ncbi:prevent-host-death protein [Kalymmatonema gypsitolerans NIES-4073]|uniref:type II toxin-antitoxin system Phd/YefM family antitoxin n=1 Tax=unclassified Scytonema TaxID=2618749 RepID=UPI00093792B1|nr:type II toxin-antitoxin system prevent-host-death family antitoxin [Scytonema sp. HK-05]OKH58971.1 prevent-host-death protein [Scytonema sp. HK-05]BAY47064.1 prevent-host-death protein [Scytonema sp. HK-05]BAZ24037.1 prevent-host-death protein [Scytonema sp. NIES-4073]
MESVGSYEAKTHLPALLERVAKGEEFVITKHGVPIARLVPVDQNQQRDVRSVIEELKQFRKGHTLGGLSVREMINEGRR